MNHRGAGQPCEFNTFLKNTPVALYRKRGQISRFSLQNCPFPTQFGRPVFEVDCPNFSESIQDVISAHLDGRVKPLIESKKASVLYLPAYSPDLNPIELSFSKLKSILRKEKIRDVPTLQKFLLKSGQLLTKKECRAYFKHNGYVVHKR